MLNVEYFEFIYWQTNLFLDMSLAVVVSAFHHILTKLEPQ